MINSFFVFSVEHIKRYLLKRSTTQTLTTVIDESFENVVIYVSPIPNQYIDVPNSSTIQELNNIFPTDYENQITLYYSLNN